MCATRGTTRHPAQIRQTSSQQNLLPSRAESQIGAVPDVNGIWPAAVQIEMICALLL